MRKEENLGNREAIKARGSRKNHGDTGSVEQWRFTSRSLVTVGGDSRPMNKRNAEGARTHSSYVKTRSNFHLESSSFVFAAMSFGFTLSFSFRVYLVIHELHYEW